MSRKNQKCKTHTELTMWFWRIEKTTALGANQTSKPKSPASRLFSQDVQHNTRTWCLRIGRRLHWAALSVDSWLTGESIGDYSAIRVAAGYTLEQHSLSTQSRNSMRDI